MIAMRAHTEAQLEVLSMDRGLADSLVAAERERLMNGFANATKQMLQQIDVLEKDV